MAGRALEVGHGQRRATRRRRGVEGASWGILRRLAAAGGLAALAGGCSDGGGDDQGDASASGTTTVATVSSTASESDATSDGTTMSGSGSMSATGTATESSTTMNVTVTVTETGTSGTATDPTMGTSVGTDTDTDTDGDLCLGGTLCGQPATCCPMGNECIESQCLPSCPSEVRCGPMLEICCDEGDVCSGDQCVTPGESCEDSYDCMPGEYCEPTLEKCLLQPDPITCEIVPDFDALNVNLEWSFTTDQIVSIPVVTDLNGDGEPEVVVNLTHKDGLSWVGGLIVAINGKTGEELWRIEHQPAMMKYGSHGRASIAAADVSGDGLPDIIYAGRQDGNGRSPIHAVDGTGALLWTAHNAQNQQVVTTVQNGAATLANFDADPEAEVVFGAMLIDNDGLVVWNQGGDGGKYGTSGNYTGGISAVLDLDGDNVPEIVSGQHAWKVDWQTDGNNKPVVQVTQLWQNTDGGDGFPAIADLDGNGTPEVILAANAQVRVVDGLTGKLWCGIDPSGVACNGNDALRTKPIAVRGGGLGGPPTVADFDGDGRPEVGIAGATRYAVYDFNRMDEEIVKPMNDPNPAGGAIFVRWERVTKDASSNVTGSSVFDFQGDGAAEVIYADECFMRVYSGADGTIQLEIENSSGTIHEYPLVVDVDADGNSEILVVANQYGGCNKLRQGLYVYGDAGDGWVPTRKVWNQHTYHVTNVIRMQRIRPARQRTRQCVFSDRSTSTLACTDLGMIFRGAWRRRSPSRACARSGPGAGCTRSPTAGCPALSSACSQAARRSSSSVIGSAAATSGSASGSGATRSRSTRPAGRRWPSSPASRPRRAETTMRARARTSSPPGSTSRTRGPGVTTLADRSRSNLQDRGLERRPGAPASLCNPVARRSRCASWSSASSVSTSTRT
ncbi:MAG: hypothetical protein R3B09_22170 [Nannocystaceae bacterium]